MKKTSDKYRKSGPGLTRVIFMRLMPAVLLCLLFVSCFISRSDAIVLYSDTFNRCVFEITTDSHANGWNRAEFWILYYDKNGKSHTKILDIKDDMSKGDKISIDLNESFARPFQLEFYMDFGGGMTVRNQSGKVRYIFQNNVVMEEEYSAWSSPFNSSATWRIFVLPEVPIMSLIDEDTGFEREMESLASAFKEADKDSKQTIRLMSDVELTAPIEVKTDNITLDLNGYAIKGENAGRKSTFDGRLFYVNRGAGLNIIDSKSDRKNSTKIKGGVLINGLSDNDGGGIYVDTGGSLSINGCTISNCDTDENGGAIYCKGDLRLDGTKINYCDAEENGGGIFLTEAAKAELKDVTIDDCDSDENGGGIVLDGDAFAEVKNITILDCDADDFGGGIFMTKESGMNADGMDIKNCKAEDGGGIYDESEYQLGIKGSTIRQCRAEDYGGGMYYQAGWLKMTDCEWNGCYAADDGGGVYLVTRNGGDTSQQFIKHKFRNCESGDCGGAVYTIDDAAAGAVAPTTFQNCTFKENKAGEGGAFYLNSIKVYFLNTSITDNTATGEDGGGIYVDSLKDIEMAGKMVIRNNKSSEGTSNLSLQDGMASTAMIYSGGLYDGSYVGVSSTTSGKVTIAKNVSVFNAMKYIHPDKSGRTIRTENLHVVMTPLVASVISENASIIIIIAGLIILAAVICILIYMKRRKEAAGTDEDA